MAEKEFYSVDRISEGIATLVSDSGRQITLNCADFELSVNDVVEITTEGGKVTSLIKSEDEKQRRLKKNTDRLHSLFSKSKKK